MIFTTCFVRIPTPFEQVTDHHRSIFRSISRRKVFTRTFVGRVQNIPGQADHGDHGGVGHRVDADFSDADDGIVLFSRNCRHGVNIGVYLAARPSEACPGKSVTLLEWATTF